MARSRSGTRGRRGPRKPPRRDGAFGQAAVQVLDPKDRGAVELPATITVKELAELLAVNPADVIRELIKSGIFATINQLIDRDTASLVSGELGYEVAEAVHTNGTDGADGAGDEAIGEATKELLFEEDDPSLLQPRAPHAERHLTERDSGEHRCHDPIEPVRHAGSLPTLLPTSACSSSIARSTPRR